MAASYNDGTVQYGSRVVTINAVAYVADNIEITRPTNIIERTQEAGEPSGWVAVPGFPTGTATLQLASGATVIPTLGLTFSTDFGAGAETWAIVEVGQPEAKDAEKKVNITFRKDIAA